MLATTNVNIRCFTQENAPVMHQFSAANKRDVEYGYDSNGELDPFYDAVDVIVEHLEDDIPHVESLGTLYVTETPPEVSTELSNTPSNKVEISAMNLAQLNVDLESKELPRQGNTSALS